MQDARLAKLQRRCALLFPDPVAFLVRDHWLTLQLQVDGQAFETMDWAETIKAARSAGVSDPIVKVGDFISGFYGTATGTDRSAREHLAVVKPYKQVKDGAVACGRR